MRKIILILILIILVSLIVLGVSFSSIGKKNLLEENKTPDTSLDSGNNNSAPNQNIQNYQQEPQNPELVGTSDLTSAGTSQGGSGSNTPNTTASEPGANSDEIPTCLLVRPGNIPGITCTPNYIKKDSVSVNIKNNLGQDMEVSMTIQNCGSPVLKPIINTESQDFVFFCNNSVRVNKEIFITYILSDSQQVSIPGFINGPVSS